MMSHKRIDITLLCAATVITGILGPAVASASPPPSPPGPDDAGYCGAHTDPYECWDNTGPATPGETAFINQIRGHLPGNDTRLLQVSRATCEMLQGGAATSYIVHDMAGELGISLTSAGQALDVALETSCPGLVVGTDGAAHPA